MATTSCTLYGRRVVMADLDISSVIDRMANDAKKRLSKKTNADRIRSMTDEELARALTEDTACKMCEYWGKEIDH